MPKFRKKPVEIEARQIPEPFDYDATCDVIKWVNSHSLGSNPVAVSVGEGCEPYLGYITTLEGDMYFKPGDWIIRGVEGEFYPCKKSIFETSYERTYSE